jgi:hypothetical protein
MERLVKELMRDLRVHRSVTYSTASIEDVEFWRKAARIAGRRFGICVRTGVARDGSKVWASEGP